MPGKPKPSKAKNAPKGINWGLAKSWYCQGWEGVDEKGNPAIVFPTMEEIAVKLGVLKNTAQARAAQDGWTEAKAAYQTELAKRLQEAQIQELVDARVRIRTKALKGAELILDRVADAVEAIPAGKDAIAGAKALPALALAGRQAQQTAHVAIGLPKDGIMPSGGQGGQQLTLWARMRTARGEVGMAFQVSTGGSGEAPDDGMAQLAQIGA